MLPDASGTRLAGLDGAGGLFRVGIVVASELPRERSTILVRLMAGGRMLPGAISDLSALPEDAPEHVVSAKILVGLRHALGSKPHRDPEEQEFIASMENIMEKLRGEAREEGRLTQARAALRRVFAVREIAASPADEARLGACADLATLERWLDQALVAQSVAEALRTRAVDRAPSRRRRTASSS